jgi:hypothetical protein
MLGVPETVHHIADLLQLMRRGKTLLFGAVFRSSDHVQLQVIGQPAQELGGDDGGFHDVDLWIHPLKGKGYATTSSRVATR